MTIFWVDTLPALQGVLTSLAVEGLDPLWVQQGAEWKTQAHSFVSPDTAVQIDLKISSTGEGEWETRDVPYTDPDTGAQYMRAVFTGFRAFVLTVQAKGYDAEFAKWAIIYAERIRTNLQRNTTMSNLAEQLGVSFFKYGPIFDIEGVEDGHALSIASMDLFGYAAFTDDPTAAELVPMFTSITVTSKISGYAEGVPPNFTDTISATTPNP